MGTAQLLLVVPQQYVKVIECQFLFVLKTSSSEHGVNQLVHLVRSHWCIHHLHHGFEHFLELFPIQAATLVHIVHVKHELDLVFWRALSKDDNHVQELPERNKAIAILVDKLEHLVDKQWIFLERHGISKFLTGKFTFQNISSCLTNFQPNLTSLTKDRLEKILKEALPVSLRENCSHHYLLLRFFNDVSNTNIIQISLDLVDEDSPIKGAVTPQDDVILMWDFYNKVIVFIKRPLDYELCLIAEVNFSQNLVAKVQYNLLPRAKFHADLTPFSTKSCLQFPCNKDFTISTSQICAFDPPRSVSAPSR